MLANSGVVSVASFSTPSAASSQSPGLPMRPPLLRRLSELPASLTATPLVYVVRSERSASLINIHQLLLANPTFSIVATELVLLGDSATGRRLPFHLYRRKFVALETLRTSGIIPIDFHTPIDLSVSLLPPSTPDSPALFTTPTVFASFRVPVELELLLKPVVAFIRLEDLGPDSPDFLFGPSSAGFLRHPRHVHFPRKYSQCHFFIPSSSLSSLVPPTSTSNTDKISVFTSLPDLAELITTSPARATVPTMPGDGVFLMKLRLLVAATAASASSASALNAWTAAVLLNGGGSIVDSILASVQPGVEPRPASVVPPKKPTQPKQQSMIRYLKIAPVQPSFLEDLPRSSSSIKTPRQEQFRPPARQAIPAVFKAQPQPIPAEAVQPLPARRLPCVAGLKKVETEKAKTETQSSVCSVGSSESLGSLWPEEFCCLLC